MARKLLSSSKGLSNQCGLYSTSLTENNEDEVLPRQLQVEFQLRCEKEVEIQAIQRILKIEPAHSWQSSFSDSMSQPMASFFQSSSSKKIDPYGINCTRGFESKDSGLGIETMPCADSHLPSMASTAVQSRSFSTTLLDDHIAGGNRTSLKGLLDDSESRRVILLEKVREAQLTIQVLQEELGARKRESDNLKQIKVETERNRISLLERINTLDGQLKETSHTHSALLVEARNREAILEQMSLSLMAIQNENHSLHEVNQGLSREMLLLRSTLGQLRGDQETLQSQADLILQHKDKLQQEHRKLILDHDSIRSKLLEKQKIHCDIRSKQDHLEEEILHLKIEREAQTGKINVLEEEVAHLQGNYTALLREKELLLREKLETEQVMHRTSLEAVSLEKINNLLKKESASIKEAFHKAEKLNSSWKEKVCTLTEKLAQTQGESEATQDKMEQENLHLRRVNHMGLETNQTNPDEEEFLCDSGNCLQWFEQASQLTIQCKDLHHHLTEVQEENRRLAQEQEENSKLIKLLETQKNIVVKQQSSSLKNLQDENDQLKQRLDKANDTILVLKADSQQHEKTLREVLEIDKARNNDLVSVAMKRNSTDDKHSLTAEITRLKEKCQKLETSCVKEQNEREKLMRDNGALSLQLKKALEKDNQTRNFKNLQEELKHIGEKLAELEDEKRAVVRSLEKFEQEQGAWSLQKSEFEMNQAELEAENDELKGELKTLYEEVEELKTELKVLRDGTFKREMYTNAEELASELKTLRAELAKVWEMLKIKDNQLEGETQELKEKQFQLQKLTEEYNRGKKNCAVLVSKIAQRNQVTFSLNDKLLQEQQVNVELRARLSALSVQVLKTQRKLPANVDTASMTRQRSKSDSSIDVHGPQGRFKCC